jgi:cytochrome b pre-mRNA-processing protein 3
MLWPFNRPRARFPTIEAIYGMIVAQARLPVFYEQFRVPDTVNGRFDMVLLHLWLVLRRLREAEGGAVLSQALLDHFCSDMDDNLREMGVSDLTVPKRMLKFAEAFFGRTGAYDMALKAAGDELAQALARNVLLSVDAAPARPLAAYVRASLGTLAAIDDGRVLAGDLAFADPVASTQMQEQLT